MQQHAHRYIEEYPFSVRDDFYGCIREYYPPRKIDGKVPDELYYVTYDKVDKDKKSDLVINKNSLNSIKVLAYPNNLQGVPSDTIVACYAGRPERKEDVDKLCLKICEYYNAKVLPEVDTGDTVPNFRRWGKLNRLYTDPTVTLNKKQMESTIAPYGINIGSGTNKLDGLQYFRDWLYNKRGVDKYGNPRYTFHYIYDIPTLREISNYSFDGNFDRVSALIVAMFQLKAMQVKKRSDLINDNRTTNEASIFAQIGKFGYKD